MERSQASGAWRCRQFAPRTAVIVTATNNRTAFQIRVDARQRTLAALVLSLAIALLTAAPALSQEKPVSDAERAAKMVPTKIAGSFRGGELIEIEVRGRMAYVVKPTGKPDPKRRWLWEFPFWLGINDGFGNLQHRRYVEELLAAGFHVVGIDVGPSCASPLAAEVCQEFYKTVVAKYDLNPRARIMGQSHGGLIAYGWACRNPECVERIAGICPATDFRTWPTMTNVIPFSKQGGLGYDLSLEELTRRSADFNPIDNLAPLAKAGAKILHIHGNQDDLVPIGANSIELAIRYRELGGTADVVVLHSVAHGGQILYESDSLLRFLRDD